MTFEEELFDPRHSRDPEFALRPQEIQHLLGLEPNEQETLNLARATSEGNASPKAIASCLRLSLKI